MVVQMKNVSVPYSQCKKAFSTYKLLTSGADSSLPSRPSSPQVFLSQGSFLVFSATLKHIFLVVKC